jgi:hypothetical protein
MTNSKFTNKYNFDLRNEIEIQSSNIRNENNENNENKSRPNDIENTKTNESLSQKVFSYKNDENFNNKIKNDIQNNSLNIKVERIDDEHEKKKVIEDNKKYHDILKRKIKLNFKLLQIFLDNFYRDEFNYSRKCSYLIFGAPLTIFGIFYFTSPLSPFLSGSIIISLAGSLLAFSYYFIKEIDQISRMEHSIIGKKIRMIKNEMVLYNPLSKPILDSDLMKENKRI